MKVILEDEEIDDVVAQAALALAAGVHLWASLADDHVAVHVCRGVKGVLDDHYFVDVRVTRVLNGVTSTFEVTQEEALLSLHELLELARAQLGVGGTG